MNNSSLSERLKSARENLGITKAEAARRLNLSKIGYCRYEYGERTPSYQTLEVIAQCFNTSIDYLLGASNNPKPTQIVVDQNKEPELFTLVEMCQQSNPNTINRLISYLEKDLQSDIHQ